MDLRFLEAHADLACQIQYKRGCYVRTSIRECTIGAVVDVSGCKSDRVFFWKKTSVSFQVKALGWHIFHGILTESRHLCFFSVVRDRHFYVMLYRGHIHHTPLAGCHSRPVFNGLSRHALSSTLYRHCWRRTTTIVEVLCATMWGGILLVCWAIPAKQR